MITTNDSVVIARGIKDVYAFVADVRNDPSWNPDMLEARLAPGSEAEPTIGRGTAFEVRFKPFMGASSCTMRITDMTPARKLVIEGAPGRMKARAEFTFEPAPNGTRLTRTTQIEMPGLLRLVEPLGRRRLHAQSQNMLTALKARLEAGPDSADAAGTT